jgi:pimeloyl-ACP methyl ester carboxylesterase
VTIDRIWNCGRRFWAMLLLAVLLAPSTSAGGLAAGGAQTAGRVDIGGRSLYMKCRGSGSPVVFLDDGGYVEAWMREFFAVSRRTRVCTYDRAGLGLSDPPPSPPTVSGLARDVHTLVHAAGMPGPYVLVGHALGGSDMRMFASLFPSDVAGLVLVDALPPALLHQGLLGTTVGVDLSASRRQLQSAPALGRLPLEVMSHGFLYSYSANVEAQWLSHQRRLAGLSANSLWVTVDAGANIPLVYPQVVTASIDQMVDIVRAGRQSSVRCGSTYVRFRATCVDTGRLSTN